MTDHSLSPQFFKKPRFIPLRYRFIFLTTSMLALILATLALAIGFQQSMTIRRQLEARGVAIAQSLAATSLADILTYNYIALERSANQAAQDPDIIYVIFHDKENRVAGFSGRSDLQNKSLADPISRKATGATKVLIQEVETSAALEDGLDIAVAIYPPKIEERWGTVRVGLSLASLHRQIRQMQLTILAVGLVALICGIVISLWNAKRITQPLKDLVSGTQKAVAGQWDQSLPVRTGDEVQVLANDFTIMIREIISHRQQLENRLEEIQRLQRYTERVLTTMNDGLITIAMQGTLSTVNPAAHRLLADLNHPIDTGMSIHEAFKQLPDLENYVQVLLEHPKDQNPREIAMNHEAHQAFYLIGSGILKDNHGHAQEIILNLHDITELKHLEAMMRQNERLAALGTLAAGMAHEIRNPLSAIKTFVQLLPRKLNKPGFLDKFNRTVPRELRRINMLVDDLLELARAPKYEFKKECVRELIGQTFDLLGEELRTRGIQSETFFPENIPLIQIDANQLAKAFQNLILNAAQAMPDGGRLSIGARLGTDINGSCDQTADVDEWLTLIFSDTGPGINPDDVDNIFNPFYTTKDHGTGLGLAITHKVVVEHGGHIEVQSKLGQGAQFFIYLPVKPLDGEA